MYRVFLSKGFKKSYRNLVSRNKVLEKKVEKAMDFLQEDPSYKSLKTHKVHTRLHGLKYSSWVTGDIRLIWDYDEDDTLVLIMFDIGSHSGKRKVYN